MKENLEIKLKLRIGLLPVSLVLLLMLAIIFPFKGWWIPLLALGLSFMFGAYSIHNLKNNLSIVREMRYNFAKVGDVVEDRITVKNKSIVPTTWLEIVDQTNIPGSKSSIGINIDPHNSYTWRKRHVCTRRGLYRLGPTTINTSDLFGLYDLSIHDPSEANILITPPVVPLPQIQVASGGRTGDGRMDKSIIEQSVAVSTVRDYQPQDPLRYIHWPITAKRNELSSRVFENTPTGNWWILQDMYGPVQCGAENNNTLEVGIILSASLAIKGLRDGKAVGLIANDRQHTWITPQHANDQAMKIMRALALCETGSLPLKDLLRKSLGGFKQKASVIIITPDISMDWWDSLIWMKAKGLIPTLLVFDPLSYGAEGSSEIVLKQLVKANIQAYAIKSEMFREHTVVREEPLWEWRISGTGKAIPIKKPGDLSWKRLE
ncbi:MAG: DUF58 domain-containing protein [Brevefilum sp.]|nr:DUF58 domain-containing protein [Brevefilum sp.]MDT8381200.1 DUF58 domain-containing protein [Brevefilum sp.]MDW7754413.1 DUF58 domain-containing protein [Brevefilum sp.]